jgi:diguanylate cyclase (GGDEF)-like protein/PAS domain S-box-containing protein
VLHPSSPAIPSTAGRDTRTEARAVERLTLFAFGLLVTYVIAKIWQILGIVVLPRPVEISVIAGALVSLPVAWRAHRQWRRLHATLARDQAELDLHRARLGHLAAIVASSADAIVSTSADGNIVSWNAGAEAMFGHPAAEILGRPFNLLTPPEDQAHQGELMDRVRAGKSFAKIEGIRIRRDGSQFPVALTLSPVLQGAEGVVGISAIMRDVTEQKAQEAALERRVLHDHLTNLPNRLLLNDRLVHALYRASRGAARPAVLSLDIDGFKAINDGLGHASGNQALVEVGRRLRRAVRPMDTVARMGGDEFVVLVEDGDRAAAIRVADRVLEALRRPATIDGRQVMLQASVGIALGHAGSRAEELLRDADNAMYAAKAQGKGSYQIFQPPVQDVGPKGRQPSTGAAKSPRAKKAGSTMSPPSAPAPDTSPTKHSV